jgi:hypothetical protein
MSIFAQLQYATQNSVQAFIPLCFRIHQNHFGIEKARRIVLSGGTRHVHTSKLFPFPISTRHSICNAISAWNSLLAPVAEGVSVCSRSCARITSFLQQEKERDMCGWKNSRTTRRSVGFLVVVRKGWILTSCMFRERESPPHLALRRRSLPTCCLSAKNRWMPCCGLLLYVTHTYMVRQWRPPWELSSQPVDHLLHPYSKLHTRAAFGLDAAMDPAIFFQSSLHTCIQQCKAK